MLPEDSRVVVSRPMRESRNRPSAVTAVPTTGNTL